MNHWYKHRSMQPNSEKKPKWNHWIKRVEPKIHPMKWWDRSDELRNWAIKITPGEITMGSNICEFEWWTGYVENEYSDMNSERKKMD